MKKRILTLVMAFVMAIAVTSPASASSTGSGTMAAGGHFAASTRVPHQTVRNTIARDAAINPDVKGWLLIPNTNMSMPILQHAENNSFYEHRDIHRRYHANIDWRNAPITATYLDFRSRFGSTWRNMTSRNTVIYGHNWTNLRAPFDIGNHPRHTMLGQLPSYTSVEFARANPHIYFSTPELEGIWRVFAVGYSEVSASFFYNNPNPTDEAYAHIINQWRLRSVLNFDVEVDTTDRLLTLSTCTRQFGNFPQQRFVVVARLLRPGETENDVVNVTVNPNPQNPRF